MGFFENFYTELPVLLLFTVFKMCVFFQSLVIFSDIAYSSVPNTEWNFKLIKKKIKVTWLAKQNTIQFVYTRTKTTQDLMFIYLLPVLKCLYCILELTFSSRSH